MQGRQAYALLAAGLALAGCVDTGSYSSFVPPGRGETPLGGPTVLPEQTLQGTPVRVAALLPLTGLNADKGADLLKAAQLALAAPGSPTLDVKDTGSTPDGAANAARQAVAAGDTLILGPLTNAETAAVAAVSRPSNIPVLAFTSDRAQAQPGVWVMGLTPAQQVQRLVRAAREAGKPRIAALLPDNDLGRAVGTALVDAAREAGLPAPNEQTYEAGMGSMDAAVRAVADYTDRRGKIDAAVKQAKASGDKDARKQAAELGRQPVGPVPFDTLMLADTGTALAELGTLVPYYDIYGVQVMGPALWAAAAARGSTGGLMSGAWYAAPDPAARAAFVQAFTIKYTAPPSMLADLAFDTASIARVTAQSGGGLAGSLTRTNGFAGADGTLVLLPDGHVQRGLAVFELSHGQASVISPAPASTAAPAS